MSHSEFKATRLCIYEHKEPQVLSTHTVLYKHTMFLAVQQGPIL